MIAYVLDQSTKLKVRTKTVVQELFVLRRFRVHIFILKNFVDFLDVLHLVFYFQVLRDVIARDHVIIYNLIGNIRLVLLILHGLPKR